MLFDMRLTYEYLGYAALNEGKINQTISYYMDIRIYSPQLCFVYTNKIKQALLACYPN